MRITARSCRHIRPQLKTRAPDCVRTTWRALNIGLRKFAHDANRPRAPWIDVAIVGVAFSERRSKLRSVSRQVGLGRGKAPADQGREEG
jgi:hypothetical protein